MGLDSRFGRSSHGKDTKQHFFGCLRIFRRRGARVCSAKKTMNTRRETLPGFERNRLYFGDNLEVLRDRNLFPDECVDLIYLDPPFNSKRDYSAIFRHEDGTPTAAQISAFGDSWRWDSAAWDAYNELRDLDDDEISRKIAAMRELLGQSSMMAYVAMMALRLIELRRVLKPRGSIYLHCDPTASHYLKIVMDAIFAPKNFRNEIVWGYRTGGVSKKHFAHKHDVILAYGKDAAQTFFTPKKERVYYAKPFFTTAQDEDGRYYADTYVRDVWDCEIPAVINVSKERLGYDTQKPTKLLMRIIEASSQKGDIVLDPFCGCGTTIEAAHRTQRCWIGIDITNEAIKVIKRRLRGLAARLSPKDYDIEGKPTTLVDAKALFANDKLHKQFERWAVSLIPGCRSNEKKGGDRGMDGFGKYSHPRKKGAALRCAVQVKGGATGIADIERFETTIRDNADFGIFIVMGNANKGRGMRNKARAVGDFAAGDDWDFVCPKIQIVSVEEILDAKGGLPIKLPNNMQEGPRSPLL